VHEVLVTTSTVKGGPSCHLLVTSTNPGRLPRVPLASAGQKVLPTPPHNCHRRAAASVDGRPHHGGHRALGTAMNSGGCGNTRTRTLAEAAIRPLRSVRLLNPGKGAHPTAAGARFTPATGDRAAVVVGIQPLGSPTGVHR
jgi:hypothetical protein